MRLKVAVSWNKCQTADYKIRGARAVNRFLVIIVLGLSIFYFVKCGSVEIGKSGPLKASKQGDGEGQGIDVVRETETGLATVCGCFVDCKIWGVWYFCGFDLVLWWFLDSRFG